MTTTDPEGGALEAWIELNLVPARERDPRLLTGLLTELVHGELASEIETWFFFWEPELRLRIRWKDGEHGEANRARLAERVERGRREGLLVDWYEGAHGERGLAYTGEAAVYGPEAWPRVQRDWMNGSELALLLVELEAGGRLTGTPAFHWSRHVHLFSNQLFGTWDAEIELCLRQALGYLRHLRAAGGEPSQEMRSLARAIAAELGGVTD